MDHISCILEGLRLIHHVNSRYDEQVTDDWFMLVLWGCSLRARTQELFVAFASMSCTLIGLVTKALKTTIAFYRTHCTCQLLVQPTVLI